MLDVLLQAGGLTGFWDEYGDDLRVFGVYAAGILFYGLVVNWFYQRLDKRVMFGKKDEFGNVHVGGPGRGFVYLLFFPLVSLAFFLLLSVTLLFLGGEERNPRDVFIIAMAIVAAVRVAAYFSESTAHDVAKMLPLGLLGVFIVTEDTPDGLVASAQKVFEILDFVDVIAIYFAIVVILEYFLRTLYLLGRAARTPKPPKRPQQAQVRRTPTAQAPFQRR